MEERVQKELPTRLLDTYRQWHTRRGIRTGCDCNWCLEKMVGTAYIGKTRTPWWAWNDIKGTLIPHQLKELHPDDIGHYLVRWERERKRNIVRERLKIAKEEIL